MTSYRSNTNTPNRACTILASDTNFNFYNGFQNYQTFKVYFEYL